MLKLLRYLLFGHIHKWEEKYNYYDKYRGFVAVCQCKKCGKFKGFSC